MPKLHELLAVSASVSNQLSKVTGDLSHTFEKKKHLFEAKTVTYIPKEEGAPTVTEEQSTLQSSVMAELQWIAGHFAKAIDVAHQINVGNRGASGTIILREGLTIGPLPATTLLELEKRLLAFQQIIQAVPTLDPAKSFSPAPDIGRDVYRAREDVKTRTKKTQRGIVLYPATAEHPAQTQLISEDVPVGELRVVEYSAMLTPTHKANLLERVEEVIRAVKTARSRANEEMVEPELIGSRLLNFVLGA